MDIPDEIPFQQLVEIYNLVKNKNFNQAGESTPAAQQPTSSNSKKKKKKQKQASPECTCRGKSSCIETVFANCVAVNDFVDLIVYSATTKNSAARCVYSFRHSPKAVVDRAAALKEQGEAKAHKLLHF